MITQLMDRGVFLSTTWCGAVAEHCAAFSNTGTDEVLFGAQSYHVKLRALKQMLSIMTNS